MICSGVMPSRCARVNASACADVTRSGGAVSPAIVADATDLRKLRRHAGVHCSGCFRSSRMTLLLDLTGIGLLQRSLRHEVLDEKSSNAMHACSDDNVRSMT